MGNQAGRNAGVTGLIDVQGAPPFTARVYRFAETISAPARPRTTPGVADPAFRAEPDSMQLVVSGKVRADGFPMPTALRGAAGTVALQFHTGLTQTVDVVVTAAQINYDQAGQDTWDITLTCLATEPVTWDGWPGTQRTITAPAYSAVEVINRTKTLDPNDLIETSTRIIDLDGLEDGADATEVTKLTAYLANAVDPPVEDHKLRSATFTRDGAFGATINLVYGKTSTADDITMPGSVVQVDPKGLKTAGTHTELYEIVEGVEPPTDTNYTAPVGKVIGYARETLNDDKGKITYQIGLNNSAEELEYDNSETYTDNKGLESKQSVAKVDATVGSTDMTAGFVYRGTTKKQLNSGHYLSIGTGGTRDSEQDITFAGTWAKLDPKQIGSEGRQTYIFTGKKPDGTTADPTAPVSWTGDKLQLVNTQRQRETALLDRVTYDFAVVNEEQRVEYPKLANIIDINGLETQKSLLKWWGTGIAEPETPGVTPPPDLDLLTKSDIQVTPDKKLRVFEYGPADSKRKLEQQYSSLTSDPNNIANAQTVAKLGSVGAVDSGFVARETKQIKVGHGQTLYVTDGGLRDTLEDITFPGTSRTIDPQGISTEAVTTDVYLKSGPEPGVPAAPAAGLKPVGRTYQQRDRLNMVRKYDWALADSADKLINGSSTIKVEAEGNRDLVRGRLVNTTAGETLSQLATRVIADEVLTTDPQYNGLTVDRVNDSLALAKIIKASDDKLVVEKLEYKDRYVRTLGGLARIGAAVQETDTLWKIRLQPYFFPSTVGTVTLRRRLVASQVETIRHFSLIGSRNVAPFLGFLPGTLLYSGWEVKGLWGMEGNNRLFVIDYTFAYDRLGHVDDSQVIVGNDSNDWFWLENPHPTPVVNQTFNPWVAGWLVSYPPMADFTTAFLEASQSATGPLPPSSGS